ncbi:alpha/beta hydrolase family esterase [Actinomadura craniellae]|uniref:alpha/beta hydrolase family esterase n=1 Tax=Actinomadura craniellae TaxID=2231787 RepID=UPI001F27FF7A|nr:PHB depolymerase family esterase [Actinomadura craniellae]
MSRRTLPPFLAVLLALAGCEPVDGEQPGEDGRPTAVRGLPTAAGTHRLKLDVKGPGHREYLLHVPPRLARGRFRNGRPARPLPLVLAMHGGASTMDRMRRLTGFDGPADEHGFLVAYPDGFMLSWNAGDCCGPAKVGNVDDVGFLTKLADTLVDAGFADPDRIYATGFSNGAGMAYRLACEGPGRFAAIGVVSAALVMKRCEPSRPVPVLVYHGTADRSVPYDGGGRRDINDERPFPPVQYSIDFWRRANGLPALRRTTLNRSSTLCRTTGRGRGGAEVELCRVAGGGHRWPGTATERLWDFFAAHPRS